VPDPWFPDVGQGDLGAAGTMAVNPYTSCVTYVLGTSIEHALREPIWRIAY